MADKKDVGNLSGSQPASVSKMCYACSEILPLTQFYAHPMMADGHLGICKECHKSRVRKNREEKIEYYLEFDRRRAFRADRVEQRKEYQRSGVTSDARLDYSNRYRAKNPEKRRAHIIAGNAVRDGKLIKRPCELCGSSERVHAHHDDYSKPLDVRWLCAVCHGAHHRRFDPQTGKPIEQLE